jgi:hypothetical protein
MRHPPEIENIEALRLREGIDDVELRDAIRGLRVGDVVNLTLLTGAPTPGSETLPVRITEVNGGDFQGALARPPASAKLARLRAGVRLRFSADHIHSLVKGGRSRE